MSSIKTYIRIFISVALVLFLIKIIDIDDLMETINLVSIWNFSLIVIGYTIGQIISAYKWQLLLVFCSIKKSFLQVVTSYFTGMFVNSFGLGLIGGDLARALLVSENKTRLKAVGTVLVDRLHGLVTLLLLGLTAALLIGNVISFEVLLILLLSLTAIILIWFFLPNLFRDILNKKDIPFFKKISAGLDIIPRNKTLVQITVISFIFHILQIFLHYFLALSLSIDISFFVLLAAVPFVNIMTSLPISWNGLGVREVAYVYFLQGIVTKEQAIAFSLIWLFVVMVNSLIGGVIALVTGGTANLRNENQLNSSSLE